MYLAPQNSSSTIVLTIGNKAVLCLQSLKQTYICTNKCVYERLYNMTLLLFDSPVKHGRLQVFCVNQLRFADRIHRGCLVGSVLETKDDVKLA